MHEFCGHMEQASERRAEQLVLSSSVGSTARLGDDNESDFNQKEPTNLCARTGFQDSFEDTFENALSSSMIVNDELLNTVRGYNGPVMTLDAVGKKIGITRERTRQIQKKYVTKIIETEFWDNRIGQKIGQLLVGREKPLYVEMLEARRPLVCGIHGELSAPLCDHRVVL